MFNALSGCELDKSLMQGLLPPDTIQFHERTPEGSSGGFKNYLFVKKPGYIMVLNAEP
jgi:hypothetical protein